MKIAFVTTNKHKFEEAKDILKGYPLELEQVDIEYEENHDASLETIAFTAAKAMAGQLGRPVVLEDTGLFFEAYQGFPGALPKFVFNTLGYRGIFKLLEGEDRRAYFRTVAGFCEPSGEPKLFPGVMRGQLTDKVFNPEADAMPYDRIFIPDGYEVTISDLSLAEKSKFSQRAEAFRKFGEYIVHK